MELDPQVVEERALRNAVLLGSDEAWSVLYHRSFASVYAFIHVRTGGDVHLTEEVVQESWMIAVRRLRRFDPARGPFEGWLRGIARNVIRNERRRRARVEHAETARAAPDPVAPSSGRESDVANRIALALAELPSRYQAVLRAKYRQDLPVAEIASRWGLTPKAVESLLSRAREAFRRAFGSPEEE